MALTMGQRREAYRADYLRRFAAAQINPDRESEAMAKARAIISGEARYQAVSMRTNAVPWWFIGLCHDREGSLSWRAVLHNGEKIVGTSKVTMKVPAGRGPFATWEDAAVDALKLENFHKIDNWDLAEVLLQLEAFNGFGYRGHGIPSPYLWAATNQSNERGKYVSDHVFDPNAIDRQLGCVAVMLALRSLGVDLFAPAPAADRPTAPAPLPMAAKPAVNPLPVPAAPKATIGLAAAGAGTVAMAAGHKIGNNSLMETIMHPIPLLIGIGLLVVLAVLVCDRVIRYKTTPGKNFLSAFENDVTTAASYALMKIGVFLGLVHAWLTAYEPLLSDNSLLQLLHSYWPATEVDAVISAIGLFLRVLTIGKTVPLPTFNAVAPPAPTLQTPSTTQGG